ncbi:MAG: ferrochelatase [Thiotrichales bacterium]|nr:MAG: ferrochelatase [Thiotrichales bacterium]
MKKNSEYVYQHGSKEKLGILLVNLGSPDAPTPSAVRRYLAEFLWDPRVVEVPRLLWWLILHGVILRIRPRRSAKAYKKVWSLEGSPLIATSKLQAQAIEKKIQDRFRGNVVVDLAMRYGKPSIRSGLEALRMAGARRMLILPLYPQYSATTTASVFDEVTSVLQTWRWLPDLRIINHYHDHPKYIAALANSIRQHWSEHKRAQKLLFSFHGIPQRYFDQGDPYFCHCQKTARLVAEELELKDGEWQVVFQSRFGREPWLQPYCDKTLEQLPEDGVRTVEVICPGFSADCLETLEEIDMENRDIFLKAGGYEFSYIPALNASADHIDVICEVLTAHMFGWPETMPNWDAGERAVEEKHSRERALAMGAKK